VQHTFYLTRSKLKQTTDFNRLDFRLRNNPHRPLDIKQELTKTRQEHRA